MENNNQSIVEFMSQPATRENIQKTLGERSGQFVASVASLYNTVDKLQECDKKSVMLACLVATSLDLPVNPNLGFAYIIPYKDKNKGMVAQLQLGYKAFIQLAQRSGKVKTINVTDVREGEVKEFNRMTGGISFEWIQDSEARKKTKIIGYLAYIELLNGFSKNLYMTVSELTEHGLQFSQTFKKGYGLWKEDFDSMASKTVIKLLLAKYAPLSVEMQTAQLADQSIVKGDNDFEYVDNKVLTAGDVAKDKENTKIMKHIAESKTIEDLEKCKDYLTTDEQNDMYIAKEAELGSI